MNRTIETARAADAATPSFVSAAASHDGRPLCLGLGVADTGVASITDAAVSPRRYPHAIAFAEVEADLEALIEKAIAAIVEGEPIEDEILGRYAQIASLVRAVSFREGRLLELAVERLAKANPAITVLTQSIRLPLVKAALEAVSGNSWSSLERITLDSEAPARGSYTPDLIVVNRGRHTACILDLKRSLASYGDTGRLDDLKVRMMASALVLPDWLYKNHKRLMVDTVGVAIVDGASRPSDHGAGIWALDEIDDLLEIDGVAACMAELRLRFGRRVRLLLEAEARKALGGAVVCPTPDLTSPGPVTCGHQRREEDPPAESAAVAADEAPPARPLRVTVGFARRAIAH